MNNIKEKIIVELEKPEFPDLNFLFSSEVLDVSLDLLRELLDEEKEKFSKLLKTPDNEINFEIFDDKDNLSYFWSLLNHLNNVNKTPKIKKIIENFEGEYIEFGNEIWYNKKYYEMYIYCLENSALDNEQKRIIEETVKNFKLRGIDLKKEKQDKIKKINKSLAKLSNDFSNNIVDDEAKYEYLVTDYLKIKNLPKTTIEITKSLAEKKWLKWYLFNADPTVYTDLMKYCTDANIRKEVYVDFSNFATSGKYDNRPLILEILKLKKEKSNILGYNNFAEYNMEKKMAKSPEQIFELIEWISEKAKIKALAELEELKEYFNLEKLNPYDISFYQTKFKKEKYDLDDKELKKYFEFDNVISYLHDLVNKLYGLELKIFNPGVENFRAYEVYKDNKLISYYFLDAFYREEKRPWAWADNLRSKEEIDWIKKIPVVLNVCNFQWKPLPNPPLIWEGTWKTPNLLSLRDVETIFHEFGHALHEILSISKYSELSGFWVEWDFVELPSQIHENWAKERESLVKFAKHYDTNEVMPEKMLDKLDKLKTFMSWNFVLRQNEFAILDMYLYSSEIPNNVEELDKKVLDKVNELSLFKRWEDYKMYASFGHIFWWWYAAWYYSYMWAEIIEADVFSKIKKMGIFSRETGNKFLNTILWQWCKKSWEELFFDFMGREVENKAFMDRKGL